MRQTVKEYTHRLHTELQNNLRTKRNRRQFTVYKQENGDLSQICRIIIEFREQYLWPKTDLGSFYPRDALHSAVFEFQSQVRCPSVCPSVRLSVIHRYCV